MPEEPQPQVCNSPSTRKGTLLFRRPLVVGHQSIPKYQIRLYSHRIIIGRQSSPAGGPRLSSRIAVAISIIQSILLLVHLLIYETWIALHGAPSQPWLLLLQISFAVLSVSFLASSLLAHRFFNRPVRTYYRLASIWLGFVN